MKTVDLDNLTQESLAMFIAYRAHDGQFRRDGVTPYIKHPEAVARSFQISEVEVRAVAWLHDVLEDNAHFSPELMAALGVNGFIIDTVVVLTKKPGQLYNDYIDEVLKNPLAVRVKIADIRHNLSCSPKEKTKVRYLEALAKLEAVAEKS